MTSTIAFVHVVPRLPAAIASILSWGPCSSGLNACSSLSLVVAAPTARTCHPAVAGAGAFAVRAPVKFATSNRIRCLTSSAYSSSYSSASTSTSTSTCSSSTSSSSSSSTLVPLLRSRFPSLIARVVVVYGARVLVEIDCQAVQQAIRAELGETKYGGKSTTTKNDSPILNSVDILRVAAEVQLLKPNAAESAITASAHLLSHSSLIANASSYRSLSLLSSSSSSSASSFGSSTSFSNRGKSTSKVDASMDVSRLDANAGNTIICGDVVLIKATDSVLQSLVNILSRSSSAASSGSPDFSSSSSSCSSSPSSDGAALPSSIVQYIFPRRSCLYRLSRSNIHQVRTLAANVDTLFVVVAPRPLLNRKLVDRYLAAAELAGLEVAIVANKWDLTTTAAKNNSKEDGIVVEENEGEEDENGEAEEDEEEEDDINDNSKSSRGKIEDEDEYLDEAEWLALQDRLPPTSEQIEFFRSSLQVYSLAGYPIYYTSTKTDEGLEHLLQYLNQPVSIQGKKKIQRQQQTEERNRNEEEEQEESQQDEINYRPRLSMFVGQSGTGKSSILNRLIPGLNLSTRVISARSNQGQHTTTTTTIYRLTHILQTPTSSSSLSQQDKSAADSVPVLTSFTSPTPPLSSPHFSSRVLSSSSSSSPLGLYGEVIDSPGVQQFLPVFSDQVRSNLQMLAAGFKEIAVSSICDEQRCRFAGDCRHVKEPGCIVRSKVIAEKELLERTEPGVPVDSPCISILNDKSESYPLSSFISDKRYESYLELMKELEQQDHERENDRRQRRMRGRGNSNKHMREQQQVSSGSTHRNGRRK